MDIGNLKERICIDYGGTLQIEIADDGPEALKNLLKRMEWVVCSAEEFVRESREISASEAILLLAATLYKGMAYSIECMPLVQSREYATKFVECFGEEGRFFTTCDVPDHEEAGIGAWRAVTKHTFESVLYGKNGKQAALIVVVDED